MRGYVALIDQDWYSFLAAWPDLTAVNLWRPAAGREFRSLEPGEFVFFKTSHPHNRVVGSGVFSGFVALRVSEAWEFLVRLMEQKVSRRC